MAEERDLTDEFKLSARSIAEVFEVLATLVARVAADRAIRYRGKKPHRAATLNAILLWLDTRPPAEQKRIVAEGMARLNALLDGGDVVAPPSIIHGTNPDEDAAGRRRGRKGG